MGEEMADKHDEEFTIQKLQDLQLEVQNTTFEKKQTEDFASLEDKDIVSVWSIEFCGEKSSR